MEAASVTGEVAESLRVAASIMQERADVTLDALPKLIGPLVTILTTAVVGVIVAAVFLPTFQLLFDALKGGAFKGK
jgi:type IV pilus assembly protein PilC